MVVSDRSDIIRYIAVQKWFKTEHDHQMWRKEPTCPQVQKQWGEDPGFWQATLGAQDTCNLFFYKVFYFQVNRVSFDIHVMSK